MFNLYRRDLYKLNFCGKIKNNNKKIRKGKKDFKRKAKGYTRNERIKSLQSMNNIERAK